MLRERTKKESGLKPARGRADTALAGGSAIIAGTMSRNARSTVSAVFSSQTTARASASSGMTGRRQIEKMPVKSEKSAARTSSAMPPLSAITGTPRRLLQRATPHGPLLRRLCWSRSPSAVSTRSAPCTT